MLWFSTGWLIYGLGGNNSDLGMIFGVSSIFGLGASFLGSFLADRHRNDIIIWIGGFLSIIGAFILSQSNTLRIIFAGLFITTIGGSLMFPVLFALFTNSTPAEDRNKVFGTQFLFTNIAWGLGNLVGYFIFKNMNTTEIENLDVNLIRYSLLLGAILELIAFLSLLMIRDKFAIKLEDEKSVASDYTMTVIDQKKKKLSEDFSPGALTIIILTLISGFIVGFGAGITIPYLPRLFFDIYQIDLSNLSLLLGFMTFFTAIWGKINADLADKFGRIELIVTNQMVSVTLLVVLSTYPPVYFAFLTLIVRNAVMNGVGPLTNAVQMEYSPRKYRSRINAMNTISWSLFFAIGQILGGYLVDQIGFRIPILMTASLYFIATLCFWQIRSRSAQIVKINDNVSPLPS